MSLNVPGQFGLTDPSGIRNPDGSTRVISTAAGNVPTYAPPFPTVGSYPGTSGLDHPDGGVNPDGSKKKIK